MNEAKDLSINILSDIVVHMKYAKYKEDLYRRETWEEICDRNAQMHIRKYKHLENEILEIYENFVKTKKVLPSMRSMQFGGKPIELNQTRMYNCSFRHANHPDVFSEAMFLLLSGCGFGYSVQKHHVEELPLIQGPKERNRRFVIGDSIEGWADAIKVLFISYFKNKSRVDFIYDDIRPKGAKLITSGGKAPGPLPLKTCIYHITNILDQAIGRQLTPIEVHDILCFIADAVLAGGIRRAAMISLFSHDDIEMMTAKSGSWYELNPQRGRANNSVVLLREETSPELFHNVWRKIEASGSGEPGIFWTNDLELGTNPCAEISLVSESFCNLTETNVGDVDSQEELNLRVKAATFIGTLQAGYTDFHYLGEKWRRNAEKEALLGVSMTGIGSGKVLSLNLEEAANVAKNENKRVAAIIGIKQSHRICTVKPAGTSSIVCGTSSGIHAWHAPFYIRRVRIGKNEALYTFLLNNHPELLEDDYEKPELQSIIAIPQRAPEGSIFRNENVIEQLERIKKWNVEWIKPGHWKGVNRHNVSATCYVKEHEWNEVGEWLWENKNDYTGLSFLPYHGGTYKQAPFEDIDEETFEKLYKTLKEVDIMGVLEFKDDTNLSGELACSGGSCEIR